MRLERLQNRIARLVTGAKFRTSSEGLRRELGWDSLKTRRTKHKISFYRQLKCEQAYFPEYITSKIPETRHHDTGRNLRNSSLQSLPFSSTSLFKRTFIVDTTNLWNKLPVSFYTMSAKEFKTALNKHLGTLKPSSFFEYGTKRGNSLHTQLRLGMSSLKAHLFQNLKTPSPLCECGTALETTKHFVLQCRLHHQHRIEMTRNIEQTINNFQCLTISAKLDILLQGKGLSKADGCVVAKEFQAFLLKTKRFKTT